MAAYQPVVQLCCTRWRKEQFHLILNSYQTDPLQYMAKLVNVYSGQSDKLI